MGLEKMVVHNENEVRALIKESFSSGAESDYQGTTWFSHEGQEICVSHIDFTEFVLDMPNGDSITVEVL